MRTSSGQGPAEPPWAQASAHCLAEGDSGARATAADTSVDPAASSCRRLPSQRPNPSSLMARPTSLFSVSRAQLDTSPQVGALGTSSCWGQDKRAGLLGRVRVGPQPPHSESGDREG